VALIGWRLIPKRDGTQSLEEDAGLYVAEARVKEESKIIGRWCATSIPLAVDKDMQILGLVRRGKRLPGFSRTQELRKGDFWCWKATRNPSRPSWAPPNWISPGPNAMAACAAPT
jgi:uncharacterized protein with PhoU and TrkA domain